MSSTKDLLSNEIYPRLFENVEQALPEFGFKRFAKGYISTTEEKVTGEIGKKGKVYIYENNLSRLIDVTRGSMSIWDYVQEREGLTQAQTFRRLAELAGYALTNEDLSEDAVQAIAEANHKAKLWEDANLFFIHCLSHKESKFASTPSAVFAQDYLLKTRGYSPAVLQLPGTQYDRNNPKIEVGYVPSLFDLQAYLVDELNYSPAEAQALITDARIGSSHRLSIPYRDPSGRIRGMVFRSMTGEEPKYLYSAGLEKKSILFNLKAVTGTKDLVIVEGVLDALHATAAGLPNVVAIGGSGGALTREHIESAIKYGAQKITLVLDNDRAGREGTDKALDLLLQFPKIRPYVAFVDEQHKDLDALLATGNGLEAASLVINNAIAGWEYLLNRIIERYAEIQQANPDQALTAKNIDDLQQDIITAASRLPKLESDQLIYEFINSDGNHLGVSKESLESIADELRATQNKEKQNKATLDLLNEARNLLSKGQESQALEKLQTKSREIKEIDRADTFAALLQPVNEKDLAARLKRKPDDLHTGYIIGGEEVLIPAGAISIIAAPTSHGKTTMLTNLSLRVAEHHLAKSVYLLSYEEDSDSVLISAMNTYISANLSGNNRKSIRSYYRDETNEYTRREMRHTFDVGREKFFSELIATRRLNIQYVDYDSDTLIEAIYHLRKYGNAGTVLIDYMQLLRKSGWKGTRQEELKQICMDLKDVAVETGLPLVLGAQFNREVVNPARLHPTKIGEAGDIERVANLILGFWNNNMKMLAGEDEADSLREYRNIRDHIYVELLKYRGGKPGLAGMLSFDGNTGVIENMNQPSFPSSGKSKLFNAM